MKRFILVEDRSSPSIFEEVKLKVPRASLQQLKNPQYEVLPGWTGIPLMNSFTKLPAVFCVETNVSIVGRYEMTVEEIVEFINENQ